MMNCDEALPLICRLVDGELGPEEQSALRLHMAGCDPCRKALSEQERLQAALKTEAAPCPPEGYWLHLRDAVRRETQRKTRPAPVMQWIAVAAMLLLAVVAALLAVQLQKNRRDAARLRQQRDDARAQAQSLQDSMRSLSAFFSANDVRQAAMSREGVMDDVQAFREIRNYLGGSVRWMAVDGTQVEAGISGLAASPAVIAAPARDILVISLMYVERARSGESRTLSNPQFVILSGEEASAVFQGRDSLAGRALRYRIAATKDKDGIFARVEFSHSPADEDEDAPEVEAAVKATVTLKEDEEPRLINASGDAETRRELWIWAVTRLPPANMNVIKPGT